jgi:hypothetical protein
MIPGLWAYAGICDQNRSRTRVARSGSPSWKHFGLGDTTEHSRTVSKFSLGRPNRLTTRAIRFGNGKSIRKAWMEGCPPWLFEPADRLARFLDRGADRPGDRCASSHGTTDEIDSSVDSAGSAIHCLPAGTGLEPRMFKIPARCDGSRTPTEHVRAAIMNFLPCLFNACGCAQAHENGFGILPSGGSGEVECRVERLRPSLCLIRSVRA